jgi:hypothetical protein
VSIVPAGEAKTYVNGTHISEPTVLHHVSRQELLGASVSSVFVISFLPQVTDLN